MGVLHLLLHFSTDIGPGTIVVQKFGSHGLCKNFKRDCTARIWHFEVLLALARAAKMSTENNTFLVLFTLLS